MEERSPLHSEMNHDRGAAPRVLLSFSQPQPFERFYTLLRSAKIPFKLAPRMSMTVYARDYVNFDGYLRRYAKIYQDDGVLTVRTYTPRANRRILTRQETKDALRRPLRDW